MLLSNNTENVITLVNMVDNLLPDIFSKPVFT